jgi:hypothetical protein
MTLSMEMARATFLAGVVVTVKYAGVMASERAQMGLATLEYPAAVGAGWLWASLRLAPHGAVEMLTNDGPGARVRWMTVARRLADGAYGWSGYAHDPGVDQLARERVAVVGLRAMGLSVRSLLDDDAVALASRLTFLRETACAVCGEPLTSARSIEAGVGPVCGGVEARRATARASKRALVASLTPEEMRKRLMR